MVCACVVCVCTVVPRARRKVDALASRHRKGAHVLGLDVVAVGRGPQAHREGLGFTVAGGVEQLGACRVALGAHADGQRQHPQQASRLSAPTPALRLRPHLRRAPCAWAAAWSSLEASAFAPTVGVVVAHPEVDVLAVSMCWVLFVGVLGHAAEACTHACEVAGTGRQRVSRGAG